MIELKVKPPELSDYEWEALKRKQHKASHQQRKCRKYSMRSARRSPRNQDGKADVSLVGLVLICVLVAFVLTMVM